MSLRDLLIWSLIVPWTGALQQQPLSDHNAYHGHDLPNRLSKDAAASEKRYRPTAADSLATSLSGHRKAREALSENKNTRTNASHNQRALATVSPAENAVRAPPPAYKPSATGGISRQQARSLQDWQVEDLILLATVDGKIHARDRQSGAAKWQLETDRSMVETIYHRNNRSTGDGSPELGGDPLWIVEPSQHGAVYVYAPGSGAGMQKLGFTVKELFELAPYSSEGYPAVSYNAEKRTTLYTIDAATGNIIKSFSSVGAMINDDRSCRRVSPLQSPDDGECKPNGTFTLGRTEYTIAIQDLYTAEPISTIKYFEWVPNNRDLDLTSKYRQSMDSTYVYTKHDGWVFGLEMGSEESHSTGAVQQPIYRHKLQSPVARVYDIVRPYDDFSSDVALVVLPQPVAPSPDELKALEEGLADNVFVNCTGDGSWYAFSERNYPMVTEGAATTRYYVDLSYTEPSLAWPMSKKEREKFAGVHQLTPMHGHHDTPLIEAPEQHPTVEPPDSATDHSALKTIDSGSSGLPWPSLASVILVLGLVAMIGLLYQQFVKPRKRLGNMQAFDEFLQSGALPRPKKAEEVDQQPKVREAEPAEETIFPHVPGPDTRPAKSSDAGKLDEIDEKPELEDGLENGSPDQAGEQQKQKKKATRGKRGGKKAKEKEQQAAETFAKKKGSPTPQPVEIISVAASESPQVSGPLQINSLVIHTDKVIGQGSCGTTVFEGSFEGRKVAVKRMLSQFYDLASQEVSFLQQSDDHQNVVRYFCQQKDEHFLYIAVELCQASLYEVWESEKARTEERQVQLSGLKHAIQQDVPKALRQLAAGLYYLHDLRIIHRDIKPQNILVAFPKKQQQQSQPIRLVISDFGLGKNLPENVSTLVDPTGNAGTSGWKAPELISHPVDSGSKQNSHNGGSNVSDGPNGSVSGVKRAADIFSLGCLFFWVLTGGNHPFEDENGWQQLRELNIKRDRKNLSVLARWSDAYEPMQLITHMLEHAPEHRPTARDVLQHPFFWSAEKRLAFLCDMSDHFEREPRGVPDDGYAGDSWPLSLLERRAEEVIGPRADFLAKLDRHFVDTLGKQRKYSGNRLLDLLRALRNKKNHYEDMPEEVKRRVGPLAGGYLGYWCQRFPRLLMACYQVVFECGIEDGARFRGYFDLSA
ncbi:bifunctional endoribonuclease/protein kinase ire1 [Saxophila tyrrhenica]|uniref:non-specific serine/threonine protein kinase n=1 Tax=Saxophila tyrrhenica TaxID=1690608 RepID=A0AAV9P067_9PEZI|nr:bifunctional endoribonuclease/protein kinase ire1 [Saxophila tyrrhenica]